MQGLLSFQRPARRREAGGSLRAAAVFERGPILPMAADHGTESQHTTWRTSVRVARLRYTRLVIRRFSLPIVLATAMTAVGATAPATASTVACPDAGLAYVPGKELESRIRAAVVCITNVERTGRDLPALTADPQLEVAAQWHASDMARLRFYNHTAPAAAGHGKTFPERAARAGYLPVTGWKAPILAENIYESPTTPYKVVEGFMASRAHCQNILSELQSNVGIGVAYGLASKARSTNSWPYWTQLFGTRDPGSVTKWDENPGLLACPHTTMLHPAPPAEPKAPVSPVVTTPKAPTGTASIVTVNGQQRVAVAGAAPGLTRVRVTAGRERTVRVRLPVGRKASAIRTRVIFKAGPSVMVRVSPKNGTYKAVVRTPPAGKGKLVIRVTNKQANLSRSIPVRTR